MLDLLIFNHGQDSPVQIPKLIDSRPVCGLLGFVVSTAPQSRDLGRYRRDLRIRRQLKFQEWLARFSVSGVEIRTPMIKKCDNAADDAQKDRKCRPILWNQFPKALF